MALTSAQQTEMDKLKATMAEMRTTTLETSYTLRSAYGSYFFDELEKIDKQIAAIEAAV